jgi:hypothetical protein
MSLVVGMVLTHFRILPTCVSIPYVSSFISRPDIFSVYQMYVFLAPQ